MRAAPRFTRRLPPEAERIVEMVRRRQRPAALGGAVVCSLDWQLARCWPRFVIPKGSEPGGYDLRFVRGLEVLVYFRPGHPEEHVGSVCAALRANGARLVVPQALPWVVK